MVCNRRGRGFGGAPGGGVCRPAAGCPAFLRPTGGSAQQPPQNSTAGEATVEAFLGILQVMTVSKERPSRLLGHLALPLPQEPKMKDTCVINAPPEGALRAGIPPVSAVTHPSALLPAKAPSPAAASGAALWLCEVIGRQCSLALRLATAPTCHYGGCSGVTFNGSIKIPAKVERRTVASPCN